ncbi:putative extracellular metallo proteinase mep [Bisporella sp. PMI_857]|nr:putative extracellular metallo proteinase mep [Bisporella sp. PMI_857]
MRFITAALSAGFLATQILGHPHHLAPRKDLKGRSVDLNSFRLTTTSEYSNIENTRTSEVSRLFIKRGDYIETATDLVKTILPGAEFRIADDAYIGTNGIGHVNFKQTVHGLDIDNADFNVNIAKDGSVLSYGNSFYLGTLPAESPLVKRDQVDPIAALKGASDILGLSVGSDNAKAVAELPTEHYVIEGTTGTHSDPKARLVYLSTGGELKLTWRVETDLHDDWILSYVDASGGSEVVNVVNYVADASYQVYPWGVNDPSAGSRTLETNPADTTASEFGWHSIGTTSYTTTRGNNGIAQANYEGDTAYLNDYRPTESSLNFVYDFSTTWTNYRTYANSSVAQLFYTSNVYHDLLYKLGFNEAAGNFETNNNGQGGRGNDAVVLMAQDGSGTNNANFATPVDGSEPRMRMYMWTSATPNRDCSFDASVVIHEYTHGVSNRLTGGPANSGCLSVYESGGMGEGWGDFMAIAIHIKTTATRATDYPMGPWVSNKVAGIRLYPYSTSLTTNPLTYRYVNTYNSEISPSVHKSGTIWATILYEVLWNLVEKYGITSTRFPVFSNGVPTDGRFLAMKLVIDGMALQPCSPTFIQARDAILDADEALTGGVNACALWTAFAKRGLGTGASRGTGTTGRTESFTLPSGVC